MPLGWDNEERFLQFQEEFQHPVPPKIGLSFAMGHRGGPSLLLAGTVLTESLPADDIGTMPEHPELATWMMH